jgi:hypothetical protein
MQLESPEQPFTSLQELVTPDDVGAMQRAFVHDPESDHLA